MSSFENYSSRSSGNSSRKFQFFFFYRVPPELSKSSFRSSSKNSSRLLCKFYWELFLGVPPVNPFGVLPRISLGVSLKNISRSSNGNFTNSPSGNTSSFSRFVRLVAMGFFSRRSSRISSRSSSGNFSRTSVIRLGVSSEIPLGVFRRILQEFFQKFLRNSSKNYSVVSLEVPMSSYGNCSGRRESEAETYLYR